MKYFAGIFVALTLITQSKSLVWDAKISNIIFQNSENVLKESKNDKFCVANFQSLIKDLREEKEWALKVFDAWGNVPSGLYSQVNTSYGSYDQCFEISDHFPKHHCETEVENSRGQSYRFGICVPRSCNEEATLQLMKPFLKNVNLEAKDIFQCFHKEEPEFGTLQYFAVLFLLSLALLSIFGTLLDFYGRESILTSFSLTKNAKSLSQCNNNFGSLNCLNGVRVISMALVIFHQADGFHTLMTDFTNQEYLEKHRESVLKMVAVRSDLAVDTFFVLAGILLAYNFMKSSESGEKFSYFKYYLHRYFRLIPVHATIILLVLAFGPFAGTGIKEYFFQYEIMLNCKKYWLNALFLVQNYANPMDHCIRPSWFISVDWQLYLLSPLLLFPLRKYGKKFLVAFLGISLAAMGIMLFYMSTTGFHFNHVYPQHKMQVYYSTHSRITQWLIGLSLGHYFFKSRNQKFTMNKILNVVLWLTSMTTMATLIYIPLVELRNKTSNPLLFSVYIATHRQIWALAVAWIIFACVKGYGGPVTWFLSLPSYQPLAKLSYSAYLLHAPIGVRLETMSRGLGYFNEFLLFERFFGRLMWANLAAIPMVLLVEMPIANFEKGIQRILETKKTKVN